MSVDSRARDAVSGTKARVDAVAVPAPGPWLRRARRRHRAQRSIAAVVLVALAAGGTALWASGRDRAENRIATPPDGGDPGGQWSRIAAPAPPGIGTDARVSDLTVGGPGFVAVGFRSGGRAGVWTSTDGRAWRSVEGDALPDEPTGLATVAAGPAGLVAVGTIGNRAAGEVEVPVVLGSQHGLVWEELARGIEVFPGSPCCGNSDTAIGGIQLVAGGPGLIAYGAAGQSEAAIWTSPDGAVWTRVLAESPSPDQPFLTVDALVPVRDGFLALGREGGAGLQMHSVAWRSLDGVTWVRTGERSGITTTMNTAGAPQTFAASRGDWVLVAASGTVIEVNDEAVQPFSTGAELWESRDGGVTWETVPGFPDATVLTLLTVGDVWVAGGGTFGLGVSANAWVSSDGRTWIPMPRELRDGLGPHVGAANDARAVLVGGGIGLPADVWTWERA